MNHAKNFGKRAMSLILALMMVLAIFPMSVFAETGRDPIKDQVRVIVENNTYSETEGAPWDGTLVDEWVDIGDDSTVMSCVVAALKANNFEQIGAENNYISTINDLSEFDGGFMSGWMGTLNDWFTNYGFAAFTVANGKLTAGDQIDIMYTCDYGEDLGGSWGNSNTSVKAISFSEGTLDKKFASDVDAYTLTVPAGVESIYVEPTAENKNFQVRTFIGETEYKRTALVPVADGTVITVKCGDPTWPSMNESEGATTYKFTVSQESESKISTEISLPADYKGILNDTLDQLTKTVTEPAMGTTGGEWTVLALARGEYFKELKNDYFKGYYNRIKEKVVELAGSVNKDGALHKNKSTENSRVIIALSAIGKDPRNVGGVDLVEAYSKNGMSWINKQGINGVIFALISLDTKDFAVTDTTLRETCVKYLLDNQKAGGGWALTGDKADVDICAMALQALAKYKDNTDVCKAAEKAFGVLSEMQNTDGSFSYGGNPTSESIAQVITACCAWGIDPDTDSRFVKNGKSAIDALLGFYVEEGKGFAHVLTSGGGYTGGALNEMATDQAAYALVAFDRYKNEKTSLYNMSDVEFTKGLLGDVDGDGSIDSWDATLVYAYHNGKITENDLDLSTADVDNSGSVDSRDATLIYDYHNGKIENFETEE